MAPPGAAGLAAVRSSDAAHEALRREGRTVEALNELERGLFLRREVLGDAHVEVEKSCVAYISFANSTAMTALQAGDLVLSFELLKKAEIVSEPRGLIRDKMTRMKMRAITFNNLGCFYRRRGKLHSSIQYLDKALRIELTIKKVDNPAGTHLNMCAVLSQLGRHAAALEHAQCALSLLEDAYDPLSVAGVIGRESIAKPPSVLAIAAHNAGVEYEYLGKYDDATDQYRKAAHVATIYWGEEHPKTLGIRKSLRNAEAILRGEDSQDSFTSGGKAPQILPPLQAKAKTGHAAKARPRKANHSKEKLRDRLLHLEWEDAPVGGHASAVSPANRFLQEDSAAAPSQTLPLRLQAGQQQMGQQSILPAGHPGSRSAEDLAMLSPNSRRVAGMSDSLSALMVEANGGELMGSIQEIAGSDEALMLKILELERRLAEFESKAESGELGFGGEGKIKKIRCKCETYDDVQVVMVPLNSSLEDFCAQLSKELSISVAFSVRYVDVEGDVLLLKSDMGLSNAIQDSLISRTKTLHVRLHTVLDQEREEAEEAMRIAEKERLEMEAAEQDAIREREEAEQAEAEAEAARQAAIEAQNARRKEEEEAEAAEAEAAAAKLAEEMARKQVEELELAQSQAEERLRELLDKGGDTATIEEAKQAAEKAASERNAGEQALEAATAKAVEAEEDAQRERMEAIQARAVYEKERIAAEDAEKIALKERAEYEAAKRIADRERCHFPFLTPHFFEMLASRLHMPKVDSVLTRSPSPEPPLIRRAEYEEAQRVADKEMAEYEQIKVKTEISPSQESTPARSGSPKKKASKYFADADESEVLTNEDAARLIGNNYKVHVAKRGLRTLANKRRGEMRKNGAITLQRVWRGHVDRVKHRTILMLNKNELVQRCATKLESVYRGHLARELALKIRVREARKSVFLSRYLIHDVAMPQFTPKEGAEGAALREQTIEHYQQLCKLMLFGRESCTAEDTKRPKGNPFRNVLIRFHNTREQHVRELMAMRKIFGTLQDLPTLKETLPERPLSYVSVPVHHSLSADVAASPVVSRSCIVFKQPQMLLSEYIAVKRFDKCLGTIAF